VQPFQQCILTTEPGNMCVCTYLLSARGNISHTATYAFDYHLVTLVHILGPSEVVVDIDMLMFICT